ncbi:MAG: YitT family protein [Lachnospiraceae bacterium]|nr:YitT family protein [Lachnospiraceae bacterium]
MNQMAQKRPWVVWLMILAGTGLMGVGIKSIYDPISLVTGGFTGISIIVKELSGKVIEGGIPLWLTNLALNVPLFLLALRIKGKRFISRTAVATVLLSAWLYVLPEIDLVAGDYTLAAVFGGVTNGVGIGMILLARATTGGTDLVAALIQHKLRHYSIAQIMQVLDGLIVLFGLYLFGVQPALYAIVSIFIVSKLSDALMEGFKFSKAAFIITEQYDEIAKTIMKELNRGVTGLDARGMYSGEEKCMLYCVVSKKEIVELKELVLDIDQNAFVIVTDAREVLGEGFQDYHDV